jgi:hypothetical protein
VLLFEADMRVKTRDEFQFIVDARYKVWIKQSNKLKEESIKKYGRLLYTRFYNR